MSDPAVIQASRDNSPLIDRARLFGQSGRRDAKLSPNGKKIAFVGPWSGVDNLWVAPTDDVAAAMPITKDTGAGIRIFHWARNSRYLIFAQDNCGDEQWVLYSLDLGNGRTVQLSPSHRGESRLVALSDETPGQVLLEVNDRDPRYFDLYTAMLDSGESTLVETNRRFTWIHADHFLRPRVAEHRNDDGSVQYFGSSGEGNWRPLIEVPEADEATTRPIRFFENPFAFNGDGTVIYAFDSRGRDTAAVAAWDLETGQSTILASDSRSDVAAVVMDPGRKEPIAYATEYLRQKYHALCSDVAGEFERLTEDSTREVAVISQSRDNQLWTVCVSSPHQPEVYYLYDRSTQTMLRLFSARPSLESAALARMHPLIIRSRDGLDLVSYLTLPPGESGTGAERPSEPLPLVVLVHGGPWIRDRYAFDPWIQLLANRGYAVLNVNFRGSRGFGKSFLNSGDREWGGKINDDIEDGVAWAIANGIAKKGRIALMGASFGGYATLVGLTRSPEVFACGVDIFGPSNLETFLESIPAYWKALEQMWTRRVGSLSGDDERNFLRSRSPLHHADRIRCPVLIGQGGTDPRVVEAESEQIVAELETRGVEVVYIRYPDEGHGFLKMSNQLSFAAVVEEFLARHLGGRHEAAGQDIAESSIEIPIGQQHLSDLARTLGSNSRRPSARSR